jgi:hypothetical protein
MQTIKLKNGAEEADMLVRVTTAILASLMEENPILFYELVMKARDSRHECFGKTGEELRKREFIDQNGRMHDSLRNVIVSAVSGDGLEMTLGSPIA